MAATATAQFQAGETPTSVLSAATLVGPATVFVAAGLLLPLAILFRYSFNTMDARRIMHEAFSPENYIKFFADPYYLGVLWTTLKVAALCTLIQLGIIHEPLEIMYTETAVIAGIIAVNLPYMVLTLQSVIEGINRNVEEAAFSLGAGPATMFRRVLLPLSLPGILAGTILTFILGMNAYA